MKTFQLLRRDSALRDFSDAELRLLGRFMVPEHHRVGHVFVQQGAHVGGGRIGFCLITEGTTDVVVTRPDGSVSVDRRMEAGDSFGLIALVRGQGQRTATVSALSDVSVLHLDRPAFKRLLDERSELGYKFQVLVARQLAADLRRMDATLRQAMRAGTPAAVVALVETARITPGQSSSGQSTSS